MFYRGDEQPMELRVNTDMVCVYHVRYKNTKRAVLRSTTRLVPETGSLFLVTTLFR